jgi:hypothetical protein
MNTTTTGCAEGSIRIFWRRTVGAIDGYPEQISEITAVEVNGKPCLIDEESAEEILFIILQDN